jgi:hypothetical protein
MECKNINSIKGTHQKNKITQRKNMKPEYTTEKLEKLNTWIIEK